MGRHDGETMANCESKSCCQCQLTLSVNKSSYNTYQQGVDKMRQVYKNI